MQLRLRMNVDGTGEHRGGEGNFVFNQMNEIDVLSELQFLPGIRLFLPISFECRRRRQRTDFASISSFRR